MSGAKATVALSFAALVSAMAIGASAQDNAERDVTLGVLGYREEAWSLVNLSSRDPQSNAPYLHVLLCNTGLAGYPECPLEVGKTYKATISGLMVSGITIDGAVRRKFTTQTFQCDPRPSPEGGHWEWENGDARCKPGASETVQWRLNEDGAEEGSCRERCSSEYYDEMHRGCSAFDGDAKSECYAQAWKKELACKSMCP